MKYIKKFEEFSSLNEAFNSNKLRDIIRQNGRPKYRFDNKILYDTEDKDIVDVVDNEKEFEEKYNSKSDSIHGRNNKFFTVELENGKLLVLNNFETLEDFIKSADDDTIKDFKTRIKEKIKERKKYKEVNTGDTINFEHRKHVDELQLKRSEEFLENNVEEAVSIVQDYIENFVNGYNYELYEKGEEGSGYGEISNGDVSDEEMRIVISGKNFNMIFNGDFSGSGKNRKGGEYTWYYDIEVNDISLYPLTDDLEDNYGEIDFFDTYRNNGGKVNFETDEDYGYVYDYYELYGVRREDFF